MLLEFGRPPWPSAILEITRSGLPALGSIGATIHSDRPRPRQRIVVFEIPGRDPVAVRRHGLRGPGAELPRRPAADQPPCYNEPADLDRHRRKPCKRTPAMTSSLPASPSTPVRSTRSRSPHHVMERASRLSTASRGVASTWRSRQCSRRRRGGVDPRATGSLKNLESVRFRPGRRVRAAVRGVRHVRGVRPITDIRPS